MEQIAQAQEQFSEIWHGARYNARIKLSADPPVGKSGYELHAIANGIAYPAAKVENERRYQLFGELVELIPYQDFMDGRCDAIDLVLDFLEVEVRAFRCGYLKDDLIQMLKRLELNDQQKDRIKAIGIRQLCGHLDQVKMHGLLIRVADANYLKELQTLAVNS